MESKFEVDDLVWAKMKGFPAWPGKIIEPKNEVKRPSNKKPHHFVFFFGSENYAWIPEDNVYLYSDHRNKFKLNNRIPKGFKEAVEAIEDALKAQPTTKTMIAVELPSIDEELAQIFPHKTPSPQKDYTREPLTGKKTKSPAPNKIFKSRQRKAERMSLDSTAKPLMTAKDTSITRKSTGSLTPKRFPVKRPAGLGGEPRLKKQKMIAKVHGSPSKLASSADSTKIKPKSRAELSSSAFRAEENMVLSPQKESPVRSSHASPDASGINNPMSSAGTQIEETLLTARAAAKTVIPTPSRIGFLGLGIMGQGMVMNLLRSGHEVTVWNRTALKCREFVKAGALKGNNPAEVIQNCDITFSCVADSTAVKDLVFGNSGVLQGITKGKCFVEMSTIDEETMQDVGEAIMARGGVFLESPVVGSRVPALEGQLVILAAGERKLYDDCFSCFEAIGKKSLYLGADVGQATRMKLIINMVMGSVVACLSEGMAMAEKVGLDQEDVAEVFSIGALSCPTIIHKSQAILNQKYDPHFPLVHQQKDLRLALLLGDKVEQPLYVAAAANELYKKARRLGYGDSDIAAVYRAASA
ncbi:putative oxidoreductase GLYR1 isoform X2 [Mizuhopecten yessoensis]|uniref:Cytokine-like nuclear factor N-PAC n=1 Tax=Mizuhopecten yessoensis TaxID=6573 RepID=A0A210Q960_MIZYE|nr:putative oxidoreductase GLYR1 isoform X2 [Mizuhopecten yessoensis]OWF45280.1 oxidoreductase GLYR1-like [Mizuhopecten yessoensis]